MARIRSVKPTFFTNEDLCELSRDHRLLFAGLWTAADRAGRLDDRPRRIKLAVFPWDDDVTAARIDAMLWDLACHRERFIIRYEVAGVPYIAVTNFEKNQRPHPREPQSTIPGPDEGEPRPQPDAAATVPDVPSRDQAMPEHVPGNAEPGPGSAEPLPEHVPQPQVTEVIEPRPGNAEPGPGNACDAPCNVSSVLQGIQKFQDHRDHLPAPSTNQAESLEKGTGGKAEPDSRPAKSAAGQVEKQAPKITWLTPYAEAWRKRFGGEMAFDKFAKPLRQTESDLGAEETLRRWRIYLAASGSWANAANFASTINDWAHEKGKPHGSSHAAAHPDDAPAGVDRFAGLREEQRRRAGSS